MAVRLTIVRAGSALTQGKFLLPVYYSLCRRQGHSAAGRIRYIERNQLVGNRTRVLPIYSGGTETERMAGTGKKRVTMRLICTEMRRVLMNCDKKR
jgi:hypothetical protein